MIWWVIATIAVGAVMVLVLGLCAAAADADRRLEEWYERSGRPGQ